MWNNANLIHFNLFHFISIQCLFIFIFIYFILFTFFLCVFNRGILLLITLDGFLFYLVFVLWLFLLLSQVLGLSLRERTPLASPALLTGHNSAATANTQRNGRDRSLLLGRKKRPAGAANGVLDCPGGPDDVFHGNPLHGRAAGRAQGRPLFRLLGGGLEEEVQGLHGVCICCTHLSLSLSSLTHVHSSSLFFSFLFFQILKM